jgi:hypothetical protein
MTVCPGARKGLFFYLSIKQLFVYSQPDIREEFLVLDLFDVAATEAAEKSIDAFIQARSLSQEEANRVEEAWKESTRRFNQNRHREYAQGWLDHHDRQIATHEATFGRLLSYHRGERDRYARMLGIPAIERDNGSEAAA